MNKVAAKRFSVKRKKNLNSRRHVSAYRESRPFPSVVVAGRQRPRGPAVIPGGHFGGPDACGAVMPPPQDPGPRLSGTCPMDLVAGLCLGVVIAHLRNALRSTLYHGAFETPKGFTVRASTKKLAHRALPELSELPRTERDGTQTDAAHERCRHRRSSWSNNS